jgi:GNAT superfamily N-acetyltransferase
MFTYEVTVDPAQADVDAVMRTLIGASREAYPGDDKLINWAIFLTDAATGEKTGGGATGYAVHDWMYVQFIAVPQEQRGRGIGRELMLRVETFAREHGLIGIFLDTFEFQARPFYEKLGYSLFGQIEDHPRGLHRYFLKKRLDIGAPR